MMVAAAQHITAPTIPVLSRSFWPEAAPTRVTCTHSSDYEPHLILVPFQCAARTSCSTGVERESLRIECSRGQKGCKAIHLAPGKCRERRLVRAGTYGGCPWY